MLINDVCKSCGLTRKAVAYYVEQGLVQPVSRENGYRDFSPSDVDRLKKAAVLRRLGLSTADMLPVLDGPKSAFKYVVSRKELELQARNLRQELLQTLFEDGNYSAASAALAALEQKQSILERLLNAFPGSYGKYLSLHFARYLGEPISTPEQRRAFDTVTSFLDGVSFNIPPGLIEQLDKAASGMDAKFADEVHASLSRAAADPEGYIDDNREVLETYLTYKQSEEYKSSPAGRLEELLKKLFNESGYYDVFIPAMMELSPSYRKYQEAMAMADPVFKRELGIE